MDNLCHTLVGAAFGEAGLKRRTRYGNAALMIAANLPDIDVLIFVTRVPSVSFRRGWTHGILAQIVLPFLLTGAILLYDSVRYGRTGRERPRAAWLLALSVIGVASHVFLDYLNNYGVRLLAPFDWRWFYGDTLFIVDPWLWLVLGAGAWLSHKRRSVVPARGSLAFAACYIAAMLIAARSARAEVASIWAETRGYTPRALMVGPLPVTPRTRQVIVDAGDHYETGSFQWSGTGMTFDPERIAKNDRAPAVLVARDDPYASDFLVWSRFPYWTLEPVARGTRASVHDVRFGGAIRDRFTVSVVVPAIQNPR